jgi:hypothetical protein
VQEALLRAYQHRDELRTEDDLAAWSTCVTGRLVIDRLRVRGRSTLFAEVPEGVRSERDTADIVVARDQARMALTRSMPCPRGRRRPVGPRGRRPELRRHRRALRHERAGRPQPAHPGPQGPAQGVRHPRRHAAERGPGPCSRRGSRAPAGSSGCATAWAAARALPPSASRASVCSRGH